MADTRLSLPVYKNKKQSLGKTQRRMVEVVSMTSSALFLGDSSLSFEMFNQAKIEDDAAHEIEMYPRRPSDVCPSQSLAKDAK